MLRRAILAVIQALVVLFFYLPLLALLLSRHAYIAVSCARWRIRTARTLDHPEEFLRLTWFHWSAAAFAIDEAKYRGCEYLSHYVPPASR